MLIEILYSDGNVGGHDIDEQPKVANFDKLIDYLLMSGNEQVSSGKNEENERLRERKEALLKNLISLLYVDISDEDWINCW